MQITKEQLNKIEYAMQLAEYFCEDCPYDADQNKKDWDTLRKAQEVINAIKTGV